jgi:hypothetical protein
LHTRKSGPLHSFWGSSVIRSSLSWTEIVRATPILHIRSRLARCRTAASAPGGWNCPDLACSREAEQCPFPRACHRPARARDMARVTAVHWFVDAVGRNAGRGNPSLRNPLESPRSFDLRICGNDRGCTGDVRTGLLVRRRSTLWMEANRSAKAKGLVRNSLLDVVCFSFKSSKPSRERTFLPDLGLSETELSCTISREY